MHGPKAEHNQSINFMAVIRPAMAEKMREADAHHQSFGRSVSLQPVDVSL